ncbi:MAG: hypothetical protein ACXWWD_03020 [Chitinophagaceae bacterium]
MKKYNLLQLSLLLLITSMIIGACKKNDKLFVAPLAANFTTAKSGTYQIVTPTSIYKIPIGLTAISAQDQTINLSITSPTGAVAGTHYTVSNKLVIPAGKAVDTLVVQAVFSQYQAGRRDTLIFTIQQDVAVASDINTTFTLAMRGPCFEGEILTDFSLALPGSYPTLETAFNANGSTAYANAGPYTTTVKNVTRTSPTTVDITVTNIYGVAGWEAKFTLDHSDLTNRRVTTTTQRLGSGAPLGLAAYDMYVEPPSTTQNLPAYGNFTFCQNSINLKFRLGARDPATTALAGYLSEATGGGTATYIMALKK